MDGGDIDALVAQRLRRLRDERRMTLGELGERTGLSVAHLARLEKGERQPSVGALFQLARAYGVSLSALVDDGGDSRYSLLRASELVHHEYDHGRYAVVSGAGAALSALRVELVAGAVTGEARHPGEEWLHVLTGSVTCDVDGEEVLLRKGDSLHFDASARHRLANRTARPATALVVSTTSAGPAHHPLP